MEELSGRADITIRMHYQDIGQFESELIRNMSASGLAIGTDVGLICYNDFPLNEFILGGLTTLSTDFLQMGRTAAQMILSGKVSKVH